MNQTEKFYGYLSDLEKSYARLLELLREKLTALDKYDIAKLDEIIKEEQAYVLMTKGFDQNLKSHRDSLGLRGETLGEVIEELPADVRDDYRHLHKRLRATLDQVKAINDKCQSVLETRLYTIDRAIKELDNTADPTYKQGGDQAQGPKQSSALFTKSI